MENVNQRLTQEQKNFFYNLTEYINEDIYFYGSILRADFISGKSDVDIDIFTDNESSVIYKLCNLLKLKKSDFKKSVYKIKKDVVYGYKAKYNNPDEGIDVELSIYNNKYKKLILEDHSKDQFLPFYVTIILFIIKFLFYNLEILPKKLYKRCKRFLLNENDELKFIEVDS